MRGESVTCDNCGKLRGPGNEWFVSAYWSKNIPMITFTRWEAANATHDICDICAPKMLAHAMEDWRERGGKVGGE